MTGCRGKEITVKEEPPSPLMKKRKVYSTTDANAIGRMDPVHIDFDPPPANTKRQRTSSSSACICFDGVSVPPQPTARATMKSTRAAKVNTKKELFDRLAQDFQAVAKTLEEIGELD